MKENFYNHACLITDFERVTDQSQYIPVPDDWYIAAGDIRNSTEAIEQGRYKQVNMAGASLIAAISNLFKDAGDLPFSFGGDGAIILIPGSEIPEVRKVLSFCRAAVRENFGLNFKTGVISVQKIREAGHDIRVAKLRLSDTIHQTLFWGEGLSYAENLIKQKAEAVNDTSPANIDQYSVFEGLECRWKEIPPEHDEITSYIIEARGTSVSEKAKVYNECLQKIVEVYGSLDKQNPLSEEKLSFIKNLDELSVEWKIRTWKPTFKRKFQYAFKLAFQIITGQFLMWKKTITKNTDWGRYKPDLVRHADFRKFDDGLKFVVSGTISQREKLENFLEDKFNKQALYHGVHSSENLIITCYIKNYHKHHVHFVDGSDGGYAMAAKKMKQQINAVKN